MFQFLKKLDKDLQKALITQLRNLWTHTSTAIEGNSLTLGETAFVLEEGLTISGKPLLFITTKIDKYAHLYN
jgi:Fic family protein